VSRKTLSSPNCYHLDTCYLIDDLTVQKNNREPHRIAKRVIDRLNYKGIKLSISQIAVGEFIKVAARDGYRDEVIVEFYDSLRRNRYEITGVAPSDTDGFVELSKELRGVEGYIGQTDVLIVAHSMVDAECMGLLTFADDLISNPTIDAVKRKRVNREFVITSDPFRV
jgi:predicted nucleic acid-binding protein